MTNPEVQQMKNDVDMLDVRVTALVEEFKKLERRNEEAYDALCRRIDSMWWKVGVLAGTVSILLAQVFGSKASGILDVLLGWF